MGFDVYMTPSNYFFFGKIAIHCKIELHLASIGIINCSRTLLIMI